MTDAITPLLKLPKTWAITTLGELCEKVNKIDPTTEPNKRFKYIEIASIDNSKQAITNASIHSGKDAPSRARQIVKTNDVVFSTVRTYLKNIAIVTDDLDNQIASTGFCVIRPNDLINKKMIFYYVQTREFLNRLTEIQRGTSYPAVRDSDVFAQRIPVPPRGEQFRLVAKIEELFSYLDTGVASLHAVQTQLKRYRQAVLKYAFEGKLTEEWRAKNQKQAEEQGVLKETDRSNGLPLTWQLVELKSISREIYRYPTFYGMTHLKRGVPVIRVEHIKPDGTISKDWDSYWFVSTEVSKKFPKTITEIGDIIMSVRGSIGKFGIVDSDLINAQISPNCIKISLAKSQVIPKFLMYYMTSIQGQKSLASLVSSTTVATIKAGLIAKTLVPLPKYNEQERIVETIDHLFSICGSTENMINNNLRHSERLRQSILKEAFEGKLVSQDLSDESAQRLLERIQVGHTINKKSENNQLELSQYVK